MNMITLAGTVKDLQFSHTYGGETYSKCFIFTERNSGTFDVLPCIIPEIVATHFKEGEKIKVGGEVRTRNVLSTLEITVFVTDVFEYLEDENTVNVEGFICKKGQLRITPLTNKDILDLVIASNRNYKRSDYIPTIAWGRIARAVSKFNVGTCVYTTGRLQSRTYQKRLEDRVETRVAYEYSISSIREKECE